MPHKTAAATACDTLSADAARLAQREHRDLARPTARSLGDSTDGEGFVRALREAGHELAGAEASCSAPAGAARPVVVALADAGVAVTVTARRTGAADGGRRARRRAVRGVDRRNDAAAAGRRSWSTRRRSAWATARSPLDASALRRGSGRRRSRVPPARDAVARRGPRASARIPSTGSGCSSTRPRSRSSAGPGRSRPSRRCGEAVRDTLAESA